MYKGTKVDVYAVDKTDINLSRKDLVELIDVSRLCCVCLYLFYLFVFVSLVQFENRHIPGRQLRLER